MLFSQSTRYSNETTLYKGEFADDVVILACLREAACAAVKVYVKVAS